MHLLAYILFAAFLVIALPSKPPLPDISTQFSFDGRESDDSPSKTLDEPMDSLPYAFILVAYANGAYKGEALNSRT